MLLADRLSELPLGPDRAFKPLKNSNDFVLQDESVQQGELDLKIEAVAATSWVRWTS